MALILTDFHDSIGTITLNNDCKRNALSGALIHELIQALNEMSLPIGPGDRPPGQ